MRTVERRLHRPSHGAWVKEVGIVGLKPKTEIGLNLYKETEVFRQKQLLIITVSEKY